jgi:eukaryotic-like serine/threonine-protein kinase
MKGRGDFMDPQQGPPQPDLLIGQTIGNYLVTQKLGEGGMGAVYLAEHPSIGKKVALKVLHSEFSTNQEVAARFFHEAKAVNDIGHPNIVDIVDFGIIQSGIGREQLVYFIMEYLAGVTLSQLIRSEAPLPPERALMIALQVADALSASHKCGIVHRDLKPDNIILVQRGRDRDFVKLLDFGIAKLTGGSAMGSHRTRTGIVMGTPAYMSPEQCEGRDSVDLRTDIYALGIVLYEMLTGRVPFIGEGYGEILVQHLTQRPRPPSQFRMLAAHVEAVVLKALEKRAELRYPTMEEFMRAMSDPVGYVEAHGGVGGFLQRQLVPSTAPVTTSLRITPTPPTPLPGTLIAPGISAAGMSAVGVSKSGITGAGVATAAPTTLGSASGQLQGARSKAGFIIAALVVIAAAVAGIIVVADRDQVEIGQGSDVASADQGSSIAAVDPGSATAEPGSAEPGSASESDGTAGTGTASGTDPGSAGTGTGTTGTGTTGTDTGSGGTTVATGSAASDGSVKPPIESAATITEIKVTSTPSGAKILVDGVDTLKVTPNVLTVPRRKDRKVSITLKLRGYNNHTFRSVDVGEDANLETDLDKAKDSPRCRVAERAGCKRDSMGCCLPEREPRAGSANQGSGDPDGLMRP